MRAERDRQALRGNQECDKIKHAKEKQAAAKQTFVFLACFNEKADLRSKSKELRSSGLSSLR